jgi:hypothetical protein
MSLGQADDPVSMHRRQRAIGGMHHNWSIVISSGS